MFGVEGEDFVEVVFAPFGKRRIVLLGVSVDHVLHPRNIRHSLVRHIRQDADAQLLQDVQLDCLDPHSFQCLARGATGRTVDRRYDPLPERIQVGVSAQRVLSFPDVLVVDYLPCSRI